MSGRGKSDATAGRAPVRWLLVAAAALAVGVVVWVYRRLPEPLWWLTYGARVDSRGMFLALPGLSAAAVLVIGLGFLVGKAMTRRLLILLLVLLVASLARNLWDMSLALRVMHPVWPQTAYAPVISLASATGLLVAWFRVRRGAAFPVLLAYGASVVLWLGCLANSRIAGYLLV